MKTVKRSFTLIFILSILLSLSGCYDLREIDDLAYAVGIGLDSGKVHPLKLSLQLAIPKSIGSGENSGGEKTFTIVSVEGPSIYTCLNLANAFVSRKINLSQAHIIVVSEELARKGIENYIHTINRGSEIREGIMFVVSKCSAEEYLNKTQPPLEINPRKHYELLHESYKYTGFTAQVEFLKFYINSENTGIQPVAVLSNIPKYNSSDEFKIEDSTYEEKGRDKPLGGDYIAGSIPEVSEWENQRIGLAVFKDKTMVGEIDGQETLLHLIIHNEFVRCYVTVEDPLEKNSYIIFNLSKGRDTVKRVKIENGKPMISVEVRLEADIVAIQSDINYEQKEKLELLEAHFEKFYEEEFMRFLTKTAKEFESDICGFGLSAKKQYLTWNDWMDVNWHDIYKDSNFDVEVTLRVRRPGLMLRTHYEYEGGK